MTGDTMQKDTVFPGGRRHSHSEERCRVRQRHAVTSREATFKRGPCSVSDYCERPGMYFKMSVSL